MAITSAAALEALFSEGDAPSSADFAAVFDSFVHKASAAGTALAVRSLGAGAVGSALFAASTTAAAQSLLNTQGSAAAVGQTVYDAATTASAQTVIGGGIVGRNHFEAATTASAQTVMGGGAAGRPIYEAITTASVQRALNLAATTAQAAAGTDASSSFMTPDTERFSPFAARAYVAYTCAGAILFSKRVSAVSNPTEGKFNITWRGAMPTSNYILMQGGYTGSTDQQSIFSCDGSTGNTVSVARVMHRDDASSLHDANPRAWAVAFCSGL